MNDRVTISFDSLNALNAMSSSFLGNIPHCRIHIIVRKNFPFRSFLSGN